MAITGADIKVRFGSEGADKVTGDINRIGGAVDGADKKGRGFIGTMKGVAGGFLIANVITAGTGAVVGWGNALIKSKSDLEGYQIQLEVATGSQEKATAAFERTRKMAAETPFEFPELIEGVANLEALGMSSEKWMPIIADTAAGTNKSIDQTVQAVLDASSGEFERLKEFGIRTKVEGDKVKFTFMQNGKEMVVEAENTQEGISNALMGIWDMKYDGAMEKFSNSFMGRMSTFTDNIQMRAQDAITGIFNAISAGAGRLNEFFDQWDAEGFGAAFKDLAIDVGEVLVNVAGWAIGTIPDIWSWFTGTVVPAMGRGLVALGNIAVNVAGWVLSEGIPDLWGWLKRTIVGGNQGDGTGGPMGPGGANQEVSIGQVAVKIGGWILSAGESLIDRIDTFIFGEAGDREFTIPVINVTVGRVNVLPFGDKIQEGIDTAVSVWQTAQAVHADIEEINARVHGAKVEGGDGGGGFIGYLQDEIQTEIDHAAKTWDFIVDIAVVANAEVENEDSTYNQVVGLLERMPGGWGMIHGGKVDWSFILGEPELLGFGLIDAAVWFDQHVYQPIEDGFNSIKDKFTFDIPAITINWPSPPEAPAWLIKLATNPVGWLIDQASFGDDGGSTGGGKDDGKLAEASDLLGVYGAAQGAYSSRIRGGGSPKMLSQVTVTADTSQADAAIGAVQGALAGLDGAQATTYQLGDNSGALAAVAGASASLGSIAGQIAPTFIHGDNANALAAVAGADSALSGIAGRIADTYVNGDNSNALGAVFEAAGAMAGFDGTVATGYLEAINNVGGAVADAINSLDAFNGRTATAYINVVSSGGAGFGAAVPRASGGTVREPLTLVGERGPELVSLPSGSYVHTASQSRRMLDGGGGGNTYNFSPNVNLVVPERVSDDELLRIGRLVYQGMEQGEERLRRGQGAAA